MSRKTIHNQLIVVLGPTASGKSALAVRLAKKFNGEIVSADSRQIYKGMDIGTAKVARDPSTRSGIKKILPKQSIEKILLPERSEAESKAYISGGIPHHLIDIIRPDQGFTLAQYQKKAVKIIKDIQTRGKLPLLVGGTGLYIQAVIDNLKIPAAGPDKKLRERLEKKTDQELFRQLQKLDPITAQKIDRKNRRRLIRALEVCLLTKQPFSEQRKKGRPAFDVLQVGIKVDLDELEKRIQKRTKKMFREGLIEEVKNLLQKYPADLPARPNDSVVRAFSGIGYQEIISYLKGNPPTDGTLAEAKKLIAVHTLQYARRQMTWFRRDKRIKWVKNYAEAERLVKDLRRRQVQTPTCDEE